MDSPTFEDVVRAVHNKAVEFDQLICRAKKLNDDLVVTAEKALKGIADLVKTCTPSTKKNCSVCYTRERNTCLVPCGHIFCESCAERAKRSRCFICRTRIEDSMRVFP